LLSSATYFVSPVNTRYMFRSYWSSSGILIWKSNWNAHTHTHIHAYIYIYIYNLWYLTNRTSHTDLCRSCDRALWKILIIKPTRCTNFSNLFLEWNSTCFGQFLCPPSGVFHCTHSNGICHTGLLCVQWKTPDGGQWNCPKHVEFHSKNKFEKLVHLVGFVIGIHTDLYVVIKI